MLPQENEQPYDVVNYQKGRQAIREFAAVQVFFEIILPGFELHTKKHDHKEAKANHEWPEYVVLQAFP